MQTKITNTPNDLPKIDTIPSPTTNSNSHQQNFLETFITRYNKRTQTSKQQTQTYRPVLADVRGSAGFHLAIKEIVYPIIGKRACGSKMWDIDGNEYIDLIMGFGVNLFGYNPPFIKEAIAERLEQGIHIGPQSNLAGEVAQLISELTGMERVTFSNTGTEAVMTALRLARAVTGRNKIVMFSGAYHGHFDGTLAKSQIVNETTKIEPAFIGVPPNMVADVLVLEYGNLQSLEVIKANQNELAAVIVEPVQNDKPHLQPQEFLQQLRQITQASGIALIFDEMLTGFRLHPGGAQAWFGIKADIATYGKILGGGMPIGVIAGKAAYMDRIDGGMWDYGDASSPQEKTTFFAGTYCKHPLAMAAARAVLEYLKIQGPTLQQQLNQRTSQFIQKLNSYFEEDEVPIKLANCGSIFNTVPLANSANSNNDASANLDLMYYLLIDKGVYLRAGGGLLSTAHTDEDLDYIIQAVKHSVQELRDAGFLP
ncbi:MAG: aspartate aminotransferase family protein [Desmonostoc vinosum HA7617-LM4]|jgi:glutamate-1-semialdehyde-2,1-aminomutase|nr:aspartate aminotransferase family protein [Desmonostoc vinosum HA7617-LM4]